MGIHSRDYVREDEHRPAGMAGSSAEWMVRSVVIACVAVFLAQNLTSDAQGELVGGATSLLSLSWESIRNFELWRVLTYGFCHGSIRHLFFNMVGLWVLGRMVEAIYGSRELLVFFLVGVVLSGLIEVAQVHLTGRENVSVIGASGGVMAITLLAACVFPRAPMRLLFLPFDFELRYLAAFYVVMDVAGVAAHDGVAHVAHLAGAAWGFLYYKTGLRLTGPAGEYNQAAGSNPASSVSAVRRWWKSLFRRIAGASGAPSVKLYEPPVEDFEKELDRILLKQAREGAAALTTQENEFLQYASVRMKNRRGRTTESS